MFAISANLLSLEYCWRLLENVIYSANTHEHRPKRIKEKRFIYIEKIIIIGVEIGENKEKCQLFNQNITFIVVSLLQNRICIFDESTFHKNIQIEEIVCDYSPCHFSSCSSSVSLSPPLAFCKFSQIERNWK